MPVYIAVILGVIIGAALLALALAIWWIIQAVHEFRKTIESLRATLDKASAAITPLLTDPRFDDYGKALQETAASVPLITLQLKGLTELVAKFYGIAMANTPVAPAPERPAPPPSADASDSQVYNYSELTAAALEQMAIARERGIIVDEPDGTPLPEGIRAEV